MLTTIAVHEHQRARTEGNKAVYILIVDDHEAIRRSLREWLHVSFPDRDVVCTATAEEALATAVTAVPALVIMDVRLPGMDGLEATRQLKARHPRLPVVILTHHDDLPTRARATVVGASALVSKQAIHAELVPVLEAFLPHGATSRAGRRAWAASWADGMKG